MMRWLTLCFLVLSFASATSYPAWDLETLYTRADIVVIGEVGAHETENGTVHTPLTNVTTVVGNENDVHVLWQPGTSDTIANLPVPNPGATVLLFLYDAPGSVSPAVGFTAGVFTRVQDGFRNATNEWIAINDHGELYVSTRDNAAAWGDVQAALSNPAFFGEAPAEPQEDPSETEPPSESPEAEDAAAEPRTFTITVSAALAQHAVFEAALAAWNEALAPHTITITEASDAQLIVGDPRRLGDAVSITVQHGGALQSEIHTRADEAHVYNALLHEIALQLGAAPGATGVLSPALPRTKRAITAADAAAVLQAKPAILGDINQDGVVDFHDLLRIAAKYGETGINLPEDINNDGVVDEADIAIMKEQYTFTEPSR